MYGGSRVVTKLDREASSRRQWTDPESRALEQMDTDDVATFFSTEGHRDQIVVLTLVGGGEVENQAVCEGLIPLTP